MQAPLRDRDPRQLGPYRLTARLGRGGMGTVFLGEDDAGRRVAVKVINAELADDEAFHERFRREVTAARQVRRFCTASVLDARLDGDPLYVVTEYVAGSSLDEAVREGGPLRGGDLEALAVNIATALSAIHAAGIVHRDLKPSNVLLSPTGPRVIDFGIARALDATDGPTRTGQFVGTPAYIAPELMRGEEITPAADVFSWGCVVAYAGTGRSPFGGGAVLETINRVMSAEPDLEGLDPAVRELVERSLAKDPAGRPTVKQLIQALTGEDEPPETPPAGLPAAGAPAAQPPAAEAPATPPPGTLPLPPPESRTAVDPVPPTHPTGTPPASPVPRLPQRGPREPRHVLIVMAVIFAIMAGGVGFRLLTNGSRTPDDSATTAAVHLGERPPDVKDKVFDDKFGDETSGWKTTTTPTWDASYRDRKYELHVLPTTTLTIVDAPVADVPESQLMEVKVDSNEAGGEAGVFCRGQSGGFAFLLRADGLARIARLDGGRVKGGLAVGKATDLDDGDNRIQAACVERSGSTIDLAMWVNGERVVSSVSTPMGDGESGPSGLLVVRPEGATGWPEATFDNFSLCSV
ncbi:serine/threonine-protein kinase [Actinomadura bangladeshensis]|uniref:Serine/threonine protein kinase n=1 Tax=Actinomadura bangladeshensis TaxID=453573 RepID=A0A6L9QUS7_9ACTN|nr:serine/threonine-protein kinase [Actinomadura bangladeshensis]NEA28848.1 serine/threonine protein kinase [Actinomadura bangladeshensis]